MQRLAPWVYSYGLDYLLMYEERLAMKMTWMVLVLGGAMCVGAQAQTAGQDMKDAGHDTAHATKTVAHKTAHGTKVAAKDTAHGTKVAAKDTAHGTKVAAKDTAHGTKVAAKDTGHAVKTGADKTADGTKDVVHKVDGK